MTRMNEKPIAIVMGRNYTSRLGMIRAAGMAGCDVVVIQTEGKRSKLGTIDDKSKYVIARSYSPEPDKNRLISTVMNYKNASHDIFLLPTDDYTAATIDEYLDELKAYFFVPNINNQQGAIVNLMDKSLQKKLAEEVGMNVSKEWICRWKDDCGYLIPDDILYPCFTKPQLSSQGHLKKYQKRCDSKAELLSVLHSIENFFHGPILVEGYQEIEKEYAVVGLALDNYCIIPSIIQMEVDWQGVTATGRLYPISKIPNLEKTLTTFMAKTHFMGLFDIDLYECNGKLFFNELNLRFGANGFATTYAVKNLPGLYISYLLGKQQDFFNGSSSFEEMYFSNENCLRQLYFDGKLSLRDYKLFRKNTQLHAIEFEEDILPYKQFSRMDIVLPLWKCFKDIKKVLNN